MRCSSGWSWGLRGDPVSGCGGCAMREADQNGLLWFEGGRLVDFTLGSWRPERRRSDWRISETLILNPFDGCDGGFFCGYFGQGSSGGLPQNEGR